MKIKVILLTAIIAVTTSASFAQKRSSSSVRVSSPKMSSTASATLRSPSATKTEKSLAGSVLSQSKDKKN